MKNLLFAIAISMAAGFGALQAADATSNPSKGANCANCCKDADACKKCCGDDCAKCKKCK